jgi:hypothetical protein
MTYNISFGLFRLVLGIGLVGSVIWQVTDRLANNLFRPEEYFAYFSIVTAIVAGVALTVSGIFMLSGKPETKRLEIIRLSLAVALVVVGVVYHLLLADAAPDARDIGYVWPVLPNQIIHTYVPMLIVVDYLLSIKGYAIKLRAALWVAVFPLAWLVFSLIRGFIGGWWPYWFIDPSGEQGVSGMLTYVGLITGFFLILGFLVLGLKVGVRKLIKT